MNPIIDVLNFMLPSREFMKSFHLTTAGQTNQILAWHRRETTRTGWIYYVKTNSGYPWEIYYYDSNQVYWVITPDNASLTDPSAYQLFTSSSWPEGRGGIAWSPRFLDELPAIGFLTTNDTRYQTFQGGQLVSSGDQGAPGVALVQGPYALAVGRLGQQAVVIQTYQWGGYMEANWYAQGLGKVRRRLYEIQAGVYHLTEDDTFDQRVAGGSVEPFFRGQLPPPGPIPPPPSLVTVTIQPGSATLAPGATQQFTATVAPSTTSQSVTWTATNGTITSGGLFTAANVGTATIGTVTATSVADTTKSASVNVSIQPVAVLSVTVTPQTVTVAPGGTQQFNAVVNNSVNQTVNWSTTVGTITSGGLYTAPSNVSVTTSATIVAVAQADLTVNGQATVIIPVTGAVTIAPLALTLGPGQQQQFTAVVTGNANQAVTWSVSASGGVPAGTIDSNGLYTAPTSTNFVIVTVTAVSVAVPSESASVVFTVTPTGTGVSITIAPLNPVIIAGAQITFSAVVNNSTDQTIVWEAGPDLFPVGGGSFLASSTVTVQVVDTVTAYWAAASTPPVSASTTCTINPVVTGQIDVLAWASLNQRSSQHMAGDPHAPYSVQVMHGDALYPATYPANTYFQIKNKLGHPWDIRKYDADYIYHWITENGDAVDTPACQAANGSSCWLYANAYKRFLTPLRGWPRYLTPNAPPVTIDSVGPNTTNRTVDCEAHLTGTITLGDVRTITYSPAKYTWGGSIDHGAGSGASGPTLDSVNGVDTIKNEYFYSGTIANNDFRDREEYYFVNGFGEVAWYYFHRANASSPWVWQNQTVNNTVASGGAPAPSFPCGAGKSWWV